MPFFVLERERTREKLQRNPLMAEVILEKRQEVCKHVSRKSGGPCIVVARDSIFGHISANGSTTIPVAMATKLGANILKPSLPPNTKEFEKVVKEACLEEAKHKNTTAGESYASTARKTRIDYPFA